MKNVKMETALKKEIVQKRNGRSRSCRKKTAERRANVVMTVLYAGVYLLFACVIGSVIFDVVRNGFSWNTAAALSFVILFPATFIGIRFIDEAKRIQEKYFDEYGVEVSAESEIVSIIARNSDEYNSAIDARRRATVNQGRHYMAYIETRYTVDGRTYTIKDETLADKKMNVGDKRTFTLRYDPDKPEYTDISPIALKLPLSLRLLLGVCTLLILNGIVGTFVFAILMSTEQPEIFLYINRIVGKKSKRKAKREIAREPF